MQGFTVKFAYPWLLLLLIPAALLTVLPYFLLRATVHDTGEANDSSRSIGRQP